MTEKEAKEECARLAAEHPDRETHRWVPVQKDDPRVLPPWLDPPRGGIV